MPAGACSTISRIRSISARLRARAGSSVRTRVAGANPPGSVQELAARADLAEAGSSLEQIFLRVTGHGGARSESGPSHRDDR